MRYKEISDNLDTGDIVLFSSKGLIGLLIRWFCSLCSRRIVKFSHVGIIVRKYERVMLFESTTCTEYGSKSRGVRLVPMSEVVKLFPGKMVVRQLADSTDERNELAFSRFIAESLGKPYEHHLFELMASAFDFVDWYKVANDKDFFCSELVAKSLMVLNVIPDGKSNEFTPDDFSDVSNKFTMFGEGIPVTQ